MRQFKKKDRDRLEIGTVVILDGNGHLRLPRLKWTKKDKSYKAYFEEYSEAIGKLFEGSTPNISPEVRELAKKALSTTKPL